jgi:hypothetical protein
VLVAESVDFFREEHFTFFCRSKISQKSENRMGPTKATADGASAMNYQLQKPTEGRPRRGSLPELKTAEKASAEKKVPTGPRANPLYKTRLCMNFQSTGSCPYTEKCQFAHGAKELEKWESWRSSHKSDDDKKDEGGDGSSVTDEGTRSRSHSLEKTARTMSTDFGSPQSLKWDANTPLKGSSIVDDENTPLSTFSNFSLWSSMLDDLENDHTHASDETGGNRPRAATYDNISQLRDAPTLFPCPPVLAKLTKLNLSH